MGRGGFISSTLFSDNFTLLVFDHMVSFLIMCFHILFSVGDIGSVGLGMWGREPGDYIVEMVAWGW